ncbi:MAG: glycogen/starch/alpha-glucan phosphorylase, partial [Gemmatimonadota bacterium]
LSLLDETGERAVRMGHLAVLAARRVNGVSALHTDLMRRTVFRDFHALHPDRIVNKTNGITFRRWLTEANPALTALITDAIGPAVLDAEGQLAELGPWADDAAFRERFAAQRRANKVALARLVEAQVGVRLDPEARFDVQIKRIHEYKRQLLNLLEVIACHQAIRAEPHAARAPQVRLLAGKAAAGYYTAKLIVKLATDVARTVNADPLAASA